MKGREKKVIKRAINAPFFGVVILISAVIFHADAVSAKRFHNGLYLTTNDLKVEYIRARNGRGARVLKERGPKILAAFVYSINNENTDFDVDMITEPLKVEKNYSDFPVLRLNGVYYTVAAAGGNGEYYDSFIFTVKKEDAESIAKFLKVPCSYRSNPGHKLNGIFKPDKEIYHVGDKVGLTLTITNIGDVPIYFEKGLMYGSSPVRDNRFSFKILYDGKMVKDIGSSWFVDEICGEIKLEPGEADSQRQSLSSWAAFDRPGIYTVHASYLLNLFRRQIDCSGDKARKEIYSCYKLRAKYAHEHWDDSVEETFNIQVSE